MARRGLGDRGETLIELLVSIVILGVTATAIMGALAVAANASTYHRREANTGVVMKDYIEALEAAVSQRTGASWCSTAAATYAPSYTAPTNASATPSVSLGGCPSTSANTPQFQTATVTVTASDGRTESQDIVLAPNWCYPTVNSC
jgi:type II secretory pathway pseudopilin PulG